MCVICYYVIVLRFGVLIW